MDRWINRQIDGWIVRQKDKELETLNKNHND